MVDDLRAKAGVPKTLVKQKLRLYSLYFPQNKLMSTSLAGNSVICILFLDFVRFAIAQLPSLAPLSARIFPQE